MTPLRRLLLLSVAALAGGCVPAQSAIRGQARGTEAWSWRMSANQGKWSNNSAQAQVRKMAARPSAGSQQADDATAAALPEPAADEAEMTLDPDPVAPAKKPKALVARTAPTKRTEPAKRTARPVVDLETSDSDEEFVNKIIDTNADAEDGEITMSAVKLPKTKAERAAARKAQKESSPVPAVADAEEAAPPPKTPAKKKHMTRAEKRRAKLMAKLEKKKAKEMAAREARLRGKRARVDEEERERASTARKATRNKRKGKFFKNGEGFIEDEDAAADEDEDDEASADDEDADEQDEEDADDDDEDVVVVVSTKKKAKPEAAAAARPASKPAAKGKPAPRVKSDWRGQAVDDEDPLKASKKK
jgi:hypothetical protein